MKLTPVTQNPQLRPLPVELHWEPYESKEEFLLNFQAATNDMQLGDRFFAYINDKQVSTGIVKKEVSATTVAIWLESNDPEFPTGPITQPDDTKHVSMGFRADGQLMMGTTKLRSEIPFTNTLVVIFSKTRHIVYPQYMPCEFE